MSGRNEVPVIDIAGYFGGSPAAKRAIARRIDEACATIGFLVISGHGVPAALIAEMSDVCRRFFDLPIALKLTCQSAGRGYHAVETSALNYSIGGKDSPPDYNESFSVRRPGIDLSHPYYQTAAAKAIFVPNAWPPVDGFHEIWVAYYRAMEALARTIMRLFALALVLDEHWFDDKIDHHMTNFVARNYPDQPHPLRPGQLRAGAHTDWGSVTILKTEDKPGGLEVQSSDGAWRPVPIVPGTLILNIGDLMARWTNDRWVSTMHRVVNPPRDVSTGTRRLSLAFFHQPNHDALVECLPSCAGGKPPLYPPITSGAHLQAKSMAIRNGLA
jgi:isopenicillin N synthase-like dioxygenase